MEKELKKVWFSEYYTGTRSFVFENEIVAIVRKCVEYRGGKENTQILLKDCRVLIAVETPEEIMR